MEAHHLAAALNLDAQGRQDFCHPADIREGGDVAEGEKVFGQKMPESLTIQVHVEDLNTVHLVLPMKPEQSSGELSLEELEKVAGGLGIDSACCQLYSAECW